MVPVWSWWWIDESGGLIHHHRRIKTIKTTYFLTPPQKHKKKVHNVPHNYSRLTKAHYSPFSSALTDTMCTFVVGGHKVQYCISKSRVILN